MKSLLSIIFIFFNILHVPGQGKNPAPVFIDPAFTSLPITAVGMLPTADYRLDRAKPFKQSDYLRKWLCPNLKKRGYPSAFTGDKVLTPDLLSLNAVLTCDDSLSVYLGESSYRFVFLPVVVAGATNNFGIGKKSSASIVGVIFDKEQKKMIWMHEAVGKDTGLGAIAVLSGALAIDEAMYYLMQGLPKAKK